MMRLRLLLVLLLLLTTACTKPNEKAAKPDSTSVTVAAKMEPTATENAAASEKVEVDAKAAEMAEANRLKAESEAAALANTARLAESKAKFESLKAELTKEKSSYLAALRKVRTPAERAKLADQSPAITLGPQLIEFARSYEGTDEAFTALTEITSLGPSPSNTEAMEMLSTIVEAEPGTERAAEAIAIFATRGPAEKRSEATEKLIQEYVDSEQLINVITPMVRMTPSAQNEKWIGQIIEKTTNPKVKGNALVTQLGMINRIASMKEQFADADEKTLERIGEETLAYINAERDAEELNDLADLMEAFAKENAGVVKKLETELFALKYLGIGCEAPEISGRDLDDSPFHLTDYRGKVVLLDFWGDW